MKARGTCASCGGECCYNAMRCLPCAHLAKRITDVSPRGLRSRIDRERQNTNEYIEEQDRKERSAMRRGSYRLLTAIRQTGKSHGMRAAA